ncbi:TPR repeat-containing protein YrrB [Symmachiella macrocystis]|uniref:TPR repeat-containing protein YrrB n=1 Tax=Symmachiella macrocystis TaxID=2527985 RepID=A0A5C6B2U8_9PLAN|nr:tetratricopeptide repeat protein [Symmachiella macrocystis]TWU06645.1 TPR repeat-containing protein YrrB [Symmachiella macrocystis]
MDSGTPPFSQATQPKRDEQHTATENSYLETSATAPRNADVRFQLAQTCETQGRTVEALAHYGEVIRIDAQHLNGHLGRAKLLHINGRVHDAAADYRRILKFAPVHPTALVGLAHIAIQDGRLDDAAQSLQTALEHHPGFAFAHHSLGRVRKAMGDFSNSAVSFQRATELAPQSVESYTELAAVYEKLGQAADAETTYRAALDNATPNGAIWNGLGLLLLADERNSEAADCFRAGLEINPEFPQAANNLGLALNKLGDPEAAIEAFRNARRGLPRSADVLSNLAHAYLTVGQLDDAEQSCRAALIIDPCHVPTLSNGGQIALRRGAAERARAFFQQAVNLSPNFAEGHNNLGTALYALNHDDEAAASFGTCISLNPQHVEAHYNRALANFRCGQSDAAWPDYQWRWQRSGARRPQLSIPEWKGEALGGKTLLVYGEQGVGDELMLASCYAEIIGQAKACVLVCESRLVELFARSFPGTTVIATRDAESFLASGRIGPVDFQTAAGELPRYSATSLGNGPASAAFLQPDAAQVRNWSDRFAQLNAKFCVGISWRGGAAADDRQRRSTTLSQWQPLLVQRDIAFINLQYGDCRDELERLRQQYGFVVHDWDDANPLVDLDNFAAQIAALDLVISVDNSTVHMAGGLGVPTWVALPHSADWRWGTTGTCSYWYESLRLFRRETDAAWSETFRKMAQELAELDKRACRRAGNKV